MFARSGKSLTIHPALFTPGFHIRDYLLGKEFSIGISKDYLLFCK
jgi:hypothetical protein